MCIQDDIPAASIEQKRTTMLAFLNRLDASQPVSFVHQSLSSEHGELEMEFGQPVSSDHTESDTDSGQLIIAQQLPIAQFVDQLSANIDAKRLWEDVEWLHRVSTEVCVQRNPCLSDAPLEGLPTFAVSGDAPESPVSEHGVTREGGLWAYQVVLANIIIGMVAILVVVGIMEILVAGAFDVINNDKRLIQCQAQSYSQLTSTWLLRTQVNAVTRSALLLGSGDASVGFATAQVNGSYPAILMGWMEAGMPYLCMNCLPAGSLFTVWQNAGHAYSSEIADNQTQPIARLYRHDTRLCWQAPYNQSTGYGAWVQSDTGPLGVACSSVTDATWYINAQVLSSNANKTYTGPVSSGYTGITHMVHDNTLDVVFGGEMDGRTLSQHLMAGKPVQGEIYVVSVTGSTASLIAATEANVQLGLEPHSAGGLVGDSASNLESSVASWSDLWAWSATAASAESRGYVAQSCPSETTAAYVAVAAGSKFLSSEKPATSIQRFVSSTNMQFVLVPTSNP